MEGMYRAYVVFPATRKPEALFVQDTKQKGTLVKRELEVRVQGTQPEREKKKNTDQAQCHLQSPAAPEPTPCPVRRRSVDRAALVPDGCRRVHLRPAAW